ncbi:uncharacterized protein LOC131271274 [Anopheles coustani]|uniref:uncharacterized protein LOC131267467 n=1 Tax=Anopheles coustani TaxID=139045 RepID=UPI002658E348|nr:uncharacterized protein LOC131267467 [Anopheles coustani]XP_058128667.1 uncharacterized protein LOC131271274 [Anopheles coustani]
MMQAVEVESSTRSDEGMHDLGTESDYGNVHAAEEGVEREYRNAHDCSNHEDVNDCLRDWAVDHEESRASVNEILAIFRIRTDYELPKDARTLMKTSTSIGQEIEAVAGGEYWYKGIEKVLRNYYRSATPETDRISVQVSVDGLPLHKSSSTQVWPILMKMEQIPEAPIMMIAMFCGSSKPNDLEPFLRPFVVEANELSQRGIQFGDRNVHFNIRAIIADSPARAFLKELSVEFV